MGHIGIGELMLIALMAICVLKPSQLHKMTFILGRLWGKSLNHYRKIKSEFEQTFNTRDS